MFGPANIVIFCKTAKKNGYKGTPLPDYKERSGRKKGSDYQGMPQRQEPYLVTFRRRMVKDMGAKS